MISTYCFYFISETLYKKKIDELVIIAAVNINQHSKPRISEKAADAGKERKASLGCFVADNDAAAEKYIARNSDRNTSAMSDCKLFMASACNDKAARRPRHRGRRYCPTRSL